jgi:hypothetical protein
MFQTRKNKHLLCQLDWPWPSCGRLAAPGPTRSIWIVHTRPHRSVTVIYGKLPDSPGTLSRGGQRLRVARNDPRIQNSTRFQLAGTVLCPSCHDFKVSRTSGWGQHRKRQRHLLRIEIRLIMAFITQFGQRSEIPRETSA